MTPSPSRVLLPVRWPAIAAFFRGYLHQDAGLEHASIEAAFDQFWAEASADERAAFAKEWRVLSTRLGGRVWRRVEPVVSALGAAWVPGAGKGFRSLREHIAHRIDATIER